MSGNGVDFQAMFELLGQLAEEVRAIKQGQAAFQAELRVEIASLRGEVVHYHGTVVGQTAASAELEERIRRVEERRPAA